MQQLSIVFSQCDELRGLADPANARVRVQEFLQRNPSYRDQDPDVTDAAIETAQGLKRESLYRRLEEIALTGPDAFADAVRELERHRTYETIGEIARVTRLWSEQRASNPEHLNIGVDALKRLHALRELHAFCRPGTSLDLTLKSIDAMVELRDLNFLNTLLVRIHGKSAGILDTNGIWHRENAINNHITQALQALRGVNSERKAALG